ncbi:hypothetical protein SAMN06295926_101455 [Lysinibacillus sp. AC-3]|nr:hypothetical protein SAMN06295926_101455 [Lysinibacillus sp. AC-3]
MNAVLSHFSADVPPSAEIDELSLRTPRPVAMTERPTSRWPKASGGCRGIGKKFLEDVSLRSSHPCDNG